METVLRVALIYVFLVVGFRIMGKREFGQLSPFEFVTLLMIPELVQQALVREDFSMTNAIVGVSTLLSLVFATSVLSYLSERFEKIVSGSPAVLVRHGSLVFDAMNSERVPPDEIVSEMHRSGLERVEQVKWGLLEPDGKITFIPWGFRRQAESSTR
jgi:uncharacterized membrane protein YcaP (DUF421 family)